ncbi:hypothetical protein JCM8547_005788 [Rhodosporidiobolus lusitaniae]
MLSYNGWNPSPPLPWRLQPVTFSLDDLSSLTTSQLALAWLVHPCFGDNRHWNAHWTAVLGEWRMRRKKAQEEGRTGGSSGSRRNKEEERFECGQLDWEIPKNLEDLDSVELALLMVHPAFDNVTMVEPARRIFAARRERDLQARGLGPSGPRFPPPAPSVRPSRVPREARGPRYAPPKATFRKASHEDVVARELTEKWTTIFVGSIHINLPVSTVWSLVAPPHLPQPVALNTITKFYGQKRGFVFCFVAYSSFDEAEEACRGLTGATYPDPTEEGQKITVQAHSSDRPAHEFDWDWRKTSEEFRRKHRPFEEEKSFPIPPSSLESSQPRQEHHVTPSKQPPPSSPPPPYTSRLSSSVQASSSSLPAPLSPSSSAFIDTLREAALCGTLLSRKREREKQRMFEESEIKKRRKVVGHGFTVNSAHRMTASLPHSNSTVLPPVHFPARPPSRPRAMRQPSSSSSSLPSSSPTFTRHTMSSSRSSQPASSNILPQQQHFTPYWSSPVSHAQMGGTGAGFSSGSRWSGGRVGSARGW